jgi:hypothetical protein
MFRVLGTVWKYGRLESLIRHEGFQVMKRSGRRRGFSSWFVEPYRQVKLGLLFVLLNLMFAGLVLGVFGFYIYDIYQAISVYFALSHEQSAIILAKLQVPVVIGGLLVLAFVVLSVLISVKYTHEIYGPLVSIHRFLDDLLNGRRSAPIHLRESDQLKELAEKLNLLMERFGQDRREPPLAAFHRFMDQLENGESPDPIKLRQDDAWYPLAERLNSWASASGGTSSDKVT